MPLEKTANSMSLSDNQDGPTATPASLSPPSIQHPKIISFDSLARCGEEIWIENKGQIYRLRRTRQGKLILTK